MSFQPVADGVVAVVNQIVHDETVNNVLYFRGPTNPTQIQLEQLAQQVWAVYAFLWCPTCAASYALVNVEVRDVSIEAGAFAASAAGPPVPGALGLNGAPGNVAFAVRHQTALSGRSYRGRTYVAGFPSSSIVGNELATGVVATAVNVFNTIRTDVIPLGFEFSICSRFANKQLRQVAILTPVVQSSASDTSVDSQRRRLSGRGG